MGAAVGAVGGPGRGLRNAPHLQPASLRERTRARLPGRPGAGPALRPGRHPAGHRSRHCARPRPCHGRPRASGAWRSRRASHDRARCAHAGATGTRGRQPAGGRGGSGPRARGLLPPLRAAAGGGRMRGAALPGRARGPGRAGGHGCADGHRHQQAGALRARPGAAPAAGRLGAAGGGRRHLRAAQARPAAAEVGLRAAGGGARAGGDGGRFGQRRARRPGRAHAGGVRALRLQRRRGPARARLRCLRGVDRRAAGPARGGCSVAGGVTGGVSRAVNGGVRGGP